MVYVEMTLHGLSYQVVYHIVIMHSMLSTQENDGGKRGSNLYH